MCTTCGCSDDAEPKVINMQTGSVLSVQQDATDQAQTHAHDHTHDHSHPHKHADGVEHDHVHTHAHTHDHGHTHDHPHDHTHDHDHSHGHAHNHSKPSEGTTRIDLSIRVLEKNDQLAQRNRQWLKERGILALNIVGSPGAGKTALLERTIRDLQQDLVISVLEGDQATVNDARRIQSTGCPVVQINTGPGCHLDAQMVEIGLQQLAPARDSVLMIENVGNLVCPALFDVGEECKVALLSTTEGEDKPIKYPHMLRASELLLINKIDLIPHLDFNIEECKQFALTVNPKIEIIEISARSGDGMQLWYSWLTNKLNRIKASEAVPR